MEFEGLEDRRRWNIGLGFLMEGGAGKGAVIRVWWRETVRVSFLSLAFLEIGTGEGGKGKSGNSGRDGLTHFPCKEKRIFFSFSHCKAGRHDGSPTPGACVSSYFEVDRDVFVPRLPFTPILVSSRLFYNIY